MLNHYRLAFPFAQTNLRTAASDIIEEPGKSVFGAADSHFRADVQIARADASTNRRTWPGDRTSQLIDVAVTPYRGSDPIAAVAMRGTTIERHVPPARQYVSVMVESALELDLSALWVMQLRSFVSWNESQIEEIATTLEPATRLLRRARNEPELVPPIPLRTTSSRVAV